MGSFVVEKVIDYFRSNYPDQASSDVDDENREEKNFDFDSIVTET